MNMQSSKEVGIFRKAELFATWGAYLSGFSLILIVKLTALHVGLVLIDRLLFRTSGITGLEEIVAMLTGLAFFAVLPYAQLEKVHVKADFIPWPSWMLRVVEKGAAMLFVIFYWGLCFALWQGLLQAYYDGMTTSVLSIPHWPFYLPAFFACFLCGIVAWMQYWHK